jgi:hypothetical protein
MRRSVSGERMDFRGSNVLWEEEDEVLVVGGGLMGEVKSTGLPIISRTLGKREP